MGLLVDWNVFLSSRSGKDVTLSKYTGLWEISMAKEIWVSVNFTSSKTRKSLKLFQNVQLKKNLFHSVPFSKRNYDDPQFLINNKILPHCHSNFYIGLKFKQERFQVSGLSLATFYIRVYVSCLTVKSLDFLIKFSPKTWVLFLRILTDVTSENLDLSNFLNNSGTSQNRAGKFG